MLLVMFYRQSWPYDLYIKVVVYCLSMYLNYFCLLIRGN